MATALAADPQRRLPQRRLMESENISLNSSLAAGCLGVTAGLAVVAAVLGGLLLGLMLLLQPPAGDWAAPLPAPVPEAVAPHGRLVIVTAEGALQTIAADGSGAQTVSADSRRYRFPLWSPDGGHIAAIGSTSRTQGIYLFADQPADEPLPLYESRTGSPIYLAWSPTGEQLGFIADYRNTIRFYLAGQQGESPLQRVASGSPFYWDWEPDGSALLIHAGGRQLAWIDAADGTTGPNLGQPGFFQAPDISADGTLVAWGGRESGSRLLAIAPRNGGTPVSIPHNGNVSFGWSPANNTLAWIAPATPGRGSYGPLSLRSTDGTVTVLEPERVFAFFWAPDGQAIAWLTLNPLTRPRLEAAAAGRRGRPALPVQNPHSELLFNLWSADLATGERHLLAAFNPGPLFVEQFLPWFDQYARSHSLWSPDGAALALPVAENGRTTIWRIPRDGSPATPLGDGVIAFWSPR
jgi:TolB protein